MDQILSGGAIEQPRGHPIRRTRLLGRRGGAHALEGGAERGALSTVTYLAGAPLAHRLLRGLDSRHSRSEEHTSELQSHSDLVCRLLLEKKKKKYRKKYRML